MTFGDNPSSLQMVDHYHNKADGLLCPLKVPCVRPNYQQPHGRAASAGKIIQKASTVSRGSASKSTINPRGWSHLPTIDIKFFEWPQL